MTLYTESVAGQADYFADVFFAKTLRKVMMLWQRYNINKFTAEAILFSEIQCKKMHILMI